MKILKKLIHFWTVRGLVWQQHKNIESLSILENYLTNAILEGEQVRKGQLVDIQNKLNESEKFLKFLTQK